jgi:hypothetical protein
VSVDNKELWTRRIVGRIGTKAWIIIGFIVLLCVFVIMVGSYFHITKTHKSHVVVTKTNPIQPVNAIGGNIEISGPNHTVIPAQIVPESIALKLKHFPVTSSQGQSVFVDVTKHPTLFFGWWCSHCGRTIREITSQGLPLPQLISSSYRDGVSIEDLAKDTEDDLNRNGVKTVPKTYYDLHMGSDVVQGFPTYFFQYKGHFVEIIGELPDPTDWEYIFNAPSK